MIELAFRYLLAKKRQTVLTLLGIFFGTAAFVTISGFLLGFRSFMENQLVSGNPHVHILPREALLAEPEMGSAFYGKEFQHIFWISPPAGRKDDARIDQPQGWYARLRADPRVAAFTPQLSANVVFRKTKFSVSSSLIGCDPTQQSHVTNVVDYLKEGSFDELSHGGNRMIAGSELMNQLGVQVFDTVLLVSGSSDPVPFKIIGSFSMGNKSSDMQAYANLEEVQKLNHTSNQVSEIAVKLKDYSQASDIATTWSTLGAEKVESWDQQNTGFRSMMAVEDALRFLILVTILIVASFGIYNVLNMTVTQRRRDIAILKSMGYLASEITQLFLLQGLLLGAAGALLGVFAGFGICLYLQTLPFSGGPPGMVRANDHLHIALDVKIYLEAAMLGVLSAAIASALPARAAGRLSPIEIIRAGTE